jgi:N-dimethylarginine dimethylaminohydrolase
MSGTAQSETGPIRHLLLKSVAAAFHDDATIATQWQALDYPAPPDFGRATGEFAALTELLEAQGMRIDYLAATADTGLDSIYVRDASVVCDTGVILCRMGKPARRGEPVACGAFYDALGLPVLGGILAPGTLEGGDVAWLDQRTIAVGRGYRTNDAGIEQLRALLPDGIEVVVVPLPHWRGTSDVFHLMSFLSPIDEDLLLVYSPLLPVPFRELLLERGFALVDVPAEEFDSMGCNVLALGERRCLALTGNPRTRSRLEAAGVEVLVYEGDEISRKGCGGPTCLTRPLRRERQAPGRGTQGPSVSR